MVWLWFALVGLAGVVLFLWPNVVGLWGLFKLGIWFGTWGFWLWGLLALTLGGRLLGKPPRPFGIWAGNLFWGFSLGFWGFGLWVLGGLGGQKGLGLGGNLGVGIGVSKK